MSRLDRVAEAHAEVALGAEEDGAGDRVGEFEGGVRVGAVVAAREVARAEVGGSGEFGFHKVRTAVRLTIDGAEMRDMEVGEWPRC